MAEGFKILLCLVGIGDSVLAKRGVESIRLAEIPGNAGSATGLGMCASKRFTAKAGIKVEFVGVHRRYIERSFHVAKLANVVVLSFWPLRPAKEDVRSRL